MFRGGSGAARAPAIAGTEGTTNLLFDPLELLERLAAFMPRPRVNFVSYYVLLAAPAAWRQPLPTSRSPV